MIVAQITEQIVKTGVESGLTVHEAYLIGGIVGLVAAVVWLFMYIKTLHSKHSREQNENIEKMTVAMTNSTHAIENNTRIIDRLFNKIVDG